jgi:hypothetical protein
VQLRGPPENIQETLNRRPGEDLERNVALSPRLDDGIEYAHQGRVCEIQVSKVQANVGKAAVEQGLERLDQVRVVGEVELSTAFQDHAISQFDRLDREVVRVSRLHCIAPPCNSAAKTRKQRDVDKPH